MYIIHTLAIDQETNATYLAVKEKRYGWENQDNLAYSRLPYYINCLDLLSRILALRRGC